MEKEFEKVYVLRFDNQQEAAEAIEYVDLKQEVSDEKKPEE